MSVPAAITPSQAASALGAVQLRERTVQGLMPQLQLPQERRPPQECNQVRLLQLLAHRLSEGLRVWGGYSAADEDSDYTVSGVGHCVTRARWQRSKA